MANSTNNRNPNNYPQNSSHRTRQTDNSNIDSRRTRPSSYSAAEPGRSRRADSRDYELRSSRQEAYSDYNQRGPRQTYSEAESRNSRQGNYRDYESRSSRRTSYSEADSRRPRQSSYSEAEPRRSQQTNYRDFDSRSSRQESYSDYNQRRPRQSSYSETDLRSSRQADYRDYNSRSSRQADYRDYDSRSSRQTGYREYDSRSSRQTGYREYDSRSSRQTGYRDYDSRSSRQTGYRDYDSHSSRQSDYRDYDSRRRSSGASGNGQSRTQGSAYNDPRRSRTDRYDYDSRYDRDRRPVQRTSVSRKKKKINKKVRNTLIIVGGIFLIIALYIGINLGIAKGQASALKDDLEMVLEYAKDKDASNAAIALEQSYEDKKQLEATLSGPFWNLASNISRVQQELDSGRELLSIVESVQDDLLTPLVALMQKQPLTNLKVGEDGFNVTLINSYLDFLEEVQPTLESLIAEIMAVDTTSMMGGYVGKYKDKLYEYTDAYNEAAALLPLIRTFLGNGEDRLYILAAQNSAEIRASGGFPGSIGTIRIQDGVLTIGDFERVYDVLADTISYRSKVTDNELTLFGSWVNAPRDACFIPAFDRVAEIWAVGYEDRQREDGAIDTYDYYLSTLDENDYYVMSEEEYKNSYDYKGAEYVEYVDGVVSLTPAIIQMLMADIGEITLADGTVLDATNATKVLQYDLYHKYFEDLTDINTSNTTADALFAETAKIVMKDFVSNFEISKFADYYKLFGEGIKKNIIQMWMKDETAEQILTDTGASGKLNFDEQNPVAGIYFSLADPSKLGWYLDLIPEIIGDPEVNNDGSRTYDIKLTISNTLGGDDLAKSSDYIIGGYAGAIRGYVHCFAPAGGYITDIEADNWMYMLEGEYKDLDVFYNLDLLIQPGESVVLTYKVTTAPGVETPLQCITTPTLTEYR